MLRVVPCMLLATILLSACESDPCGSEVMAKIMAEKFVKRELREPDSAKFEGVRVSRNGEGSCSYSVSGTVSARNGFGGMTASGFYAEVERVKGENNWKIIDIIIK